MILTLREGEGGGVRTCDIFQCTDQKNGVQTPTTFDINDVMREGGGGYNETSKLRYLFQNSLETPPN